jgi:hypothetical protein
MIVTLLGGCAIGPAFTERAPKDEAAGLLYVYRPGNFTNSAVTPELRVDEIQIARLTNNGYASVELKEGRHIVTLTVPGWTGEAGVAVNMLAGRAAFVRVETAYTMSQSKPGTSERSFKMKQVPAETGRKEIAACRMVASSMRAGDKRRAEALAAVRLVGAIRPAIESAI